jgi:hypothetical protein
MFWLTLPMIKLAAAVLESNINFIGVQVAQPFIPKKTADQTMLWSQARHKLQAINMQWKSIIATISLYRKMVQMSTSIIRAWKVMSEEHEHFVNASREVFCASNANGVKFLHNYIWGHNERKWASLNLLTSTKHHYLNFHNSALLDSL